MKMGLESMHKLEPRKLSRGRILYTILENIGEFAVNMTDLFDVFISTRYGASYGKLNWELRKRSRERIHNDELARARQQYSLLISRLQRDGILEKKKYKGVWSLFRTEKGKQKFKALREQKSMALPNPSYEYLENEMLVIVAFDIPERERAKRRWLRAVLRNLNLQMIQRSVWIGKVKLPEKFLSDLRHLGIGDAVEIFTVNKSGTLRHIL